MAPPRPCPHGAPARLRSARVSAAAAALRFDPLKFAAWVPARGAVAEARARAPRRGGWRCLRVGGPRRGPLWPAPLTMPSRVLLRANRLGYGVAQPEPRQVPSGVSSTLTASWAAAATRPPAPSAPFPGTVCRLPPCARPRAASACPGVRGAAGTRFPSSNPSSRSRPRSWWWAGSAAPPPPVVAQEGLRKQVSPTRWVEDLAVRSLESGPHPQRLGPCRRGDTDTGPEEPWGRAGPER